jgi:glycosyltransferase involved in cell wall biosynthesis
VEGFIIPIRDVEAIQAKLEWCYQHPEKLSAMGQAARQKAEDSTWLAYRQKLAAKVQALLAE